MKTSPTEIYVSTDVEADGPIPGPNSLLSLASVAVTKEGGEISAYSANLASLPGAAGDPRTLTWWQQFPDALAKTHENARPPEVVMPEYLAWVKALPGRPIFLGWPASWDFMWVYWYLVRYTRERPFGEAAVDVRSYAMGMRRTGFRQTSRTYLPKRWFDPALPHTHVALDDAREQAVVFRNMLNDAGE